jgi:hypothetical protein
MAQPGDWQADMGKGLDIRLVPDREPVNRRRDKEGTHRREDKERVARHLDMASPVVQLRQEKDLARRWALVAYRMTQMSRLIFLSGLLPLRHQGS